MRREIGHHYKRFTLPIRGTQEDNAINVRQYSRFGVDGKMLNWPGHGEAILYPLDSLEDGDVTEPVLLCEGELDALLGPGSTALWLSPGPAARARCPQTLSRCGIARCTSSMTATTPAERVPGRWARPLKRWRR